MESSKAINVEPIGGDHLPGEVTANTKTADISLEGNVIIVAEGAPDPPTDEVIDPLKIFPGPKRGRM